VPDEQGPYEIEPAGDERGGRGGDGASGQKPERPGESAGDSADDSADKSGRGAKIDAESLLEGFDEDADFDRDPEVERALEASGATAPAGTTRNKDKTPEAELGDPARWIIRPGFPSLRLSLIVGGALTLTAVIVSIVYAPDHWWIHAIDTLYQTVLTTLLGLVAVLSSAYFSERGFNEPPLALGRMLVPVAGAMLAMALPLLYGLDFLLGAGVYVLLVGVWFRLPRFEVGVLTMSHFGLWLLVQLGIEIGVRAGL